MKDLKCSQHEILDTQHLLQTFPEEIWLEILEQADDVQLPLRLCNTSSYLRQLFSPRLPKLLLPQVYSVLAMNWNDRVSDFRSLTANLRLVCKSWNHSIEHFWENAQQFPINKRMESVPNLTFPLETCSGLGKFAFHFEESHFFALPPWKNPFLGRRIILDDSRFCPGRNTQEDDHIGQFYSEFCQLLTKFGFQLWHLEIHLKDHFPSLSEYYFRLCEWMDLMPNLKTLRISYSPNGKRHMSFYYLERDIRLYRFPKLQSLQELHLNNLPRPILKELIYRHNQVEKLVVDGNIITNQIIACVNEVNECANFVNEKKEENFLKAYL